MTAPMAGIITALPVEEGEVAVIGTMNNAGTKLLTIADMSVVEAVMEVDETDVPNVKVGQRATVTIDAYPNKTFEGIGHRSGLEPDDRQRRRLRRRGGELRGEDPARRIRRRACVPASPPPRTSSPARAPKALAIPLQALVVREKPAPQRRRPRQGAAKRKASTSTRTAR